MDFLIENKNEDIYITTENHDIYGKIVFKPEIWTDVKNGMKYQINSLYMNLYTENSKGQRVYLIFSPCEISKLGILENIQLKITNNHQDFKNDDNRYKKTVGLSSTETYMMVMHMIRFVMIYISEYNKVNKNQIALMCYADDRRRFNIYKYKLYKYGFKLIRRWNTNVLVLPANAYKNINNDKIIKL